MNTHNFLFKKYLSIYKYIMNKYIFTIFNIIFNTIYSILYLICINTYIIE